MIPKRPLTAALEISTGSMIFTVKPPAFTGEAEALNLSVSLLNNGAAYTPSGSVRAQMYLYWPGTVLMSDAVDLAISGNILTGTMPETLMAMAGCPLLVVRLDDPETNAMIVAAATPIQITNVLGEQVISTRPPTPSEIVYVGRSPYINQFTGTWMEWDAEAGAYADTGVTALGRPATFMAQATTLAAGSAATAAISGTPEAPVLDLGIPRGADGAVMSVNGKTGAVVLTGEDAAVSSSDSDTIAQRLSDQSRQIDNLAAKVGPYMLSLEMATDGTMHLYLYYPDGSTPPPLSYDQSDGHLYWAY